MVDNNIFECLAEVGLSEYEARAYVSLIACNPVTAYELAKASGIPTSKIYAVLAKLSDKGVVSTAGENKYIPMDPGEFVETRRSRMERTMDSLKQGFSAIRQEVDVSSIWNIHEYAYLIEKAGRMIAGAEKTILLSSWAAEAGLLIDALKQAEARGVKVVMVHFGLPDARAGQVYHHPIEDTLYLEKGGRGFTLLADSREVLMATIHKGDRVEGAWSMNRGFVTIAEDYIKHDVYIMKIVKRFDSRLRERFGVRYEKLRDIFTDEEE